MALAGFWALPLWAHDGHAVGTVEVEVMRAQAAGSQVDLILLLSNQGGTPVTLLALSTPGTATQVFGLPVSIPPSGVEVVTAELRFDGAVPGIFAVLLNFGADGVGPVTITPDKARQEIDNE
ncbi:hypothetical protein ACMU_18760 [Actibacterium mucosum KCTC 23349]|uniref:Copper chaperone PCu(A)C n=2 Tax=Actibacterium TaxID=1433986 RepID=A0A037ZDQ2_9RHOB|nr:hypothetical protein ACMU_18760 [Actibacterium mucosum KCTC 23349]